MTKEFAEQEMERRALALGRSFYVVQLDPRDSYSYVVVSKIPKNHTPIATFEQ